MHINFGVLTESLCRGSQYPRYFAKQTDARMGGFIHTPEQFDALRANPGWDIYLHLNPTTRTRASPKASGADVTHLANILVDVDVLSGSPDLNVVAMHILDQMEDLVEGSMEAAHVIFSGRGVQLWIPFELHPLVNASSRREVETATKNVLNQLGTGAVSCKVDVSCSDVARVARCPGTVNSKNGARAELIMLGSGLCQVADLLQHVGPPPEPRQTFDLSPAQSVGYILPYVSARAANFLTLGCEEPGRHTAAYATAASLRELNISLETAEIWVAEAGHLCRPPLSPLECYRATRNAYRYEDS